MKIVQPFTLLLLLCALAAQATQAETDIIHEDTFWVAAAGTVPPHVPGRIVCDGDGESGKRVQLVYVYADEPDTQQVAAIRHIAAQMDAIVDNSAHRTGGHRHIRFVTTGDCEANVLTVQLEADSFRDLLYELRRAGHNSPDRKYLVFGVADFACGIALIPPEEPDDFASYAYLGAGCWGARLAVHELVHMLGGVAHDAPNASGGWHCTDGHDVMCYSDAPHFPPMSYPCGLEGMHLLDCGGDDYFNTNPEAGSYLATGRNIANSPFLIQDVGWTTYAPMVLATQPPDGEATEHE